MCLREKERGKERKRELVVGTGRGEGEGVLHVSSQSTYNRVVDGCDVCKLVHSMTERKNKLQ